MLTVCVRSQIKLHTMSTERSTDADRMSSAPLLRSRQLWTRTAGPSSTWLCVRGTPHKVMQLWLTSERAEEFGTRACYTETLLTHKVSNLMLGHVRTHARTTSRANISAHATSGSMWIDESEVEVGVDQFQQVRTPNRRR